MKKLVKSLEKELSQFKQKKEEYFQILLDKGLLPKKEQKAENRKRMAELNNAVDVPSVGFMSDDDDDDNDDDVRKKKVEEMPQSFDVKSIIEEFRAFPQMLSPLPLSDEDELNSSLDSSEKSTTSPSVPLQITNLSVGDKSVDDTIVPKRTEKLISSLENNSLVKKPNVLSESDINKADHSFQPVSGEKGSYDPDGLFDAADSLLRLSGHGIINGSYSSDKENELENISDKLIPSETELKKVNKTDNVPSSVDGLHFFQYDSAEDSQHMKTDSGNGENKTSLFLQSDSLTQSKPTATEANCTMQVDASQPSADKKCLNSQQRLLRKSRALHRICPPRVTSSSKDSKSDSKKLSKNTKPKVSQNSSTAKVPASSCHSPKMNISLETNPKPTAEELGAPNMEIINSAEPEKVSTLVESVNGKENVQSVRKRKLNVTKDSIEVPNEKKQCKKNNAILSRARTSLMKVAEREFQTYWKYPSTPPSQVLQKLLQSNREAELIVEVVAIQAVKLLSSTTDNMLAWYVTKCKSNAPTPYFSDKEKQLLRLFCLFKRKKEMDNIFTKFRECLQDALTKQDWDSTSLGKWSLCRMYIAMCRLEGLLSEARVFFYNSFCRLPSDQYMTFSVITACTWPLVLSYERKAGRISLFHVIEYVVIKSISKKQHNKKYFECLVKHCKWKPGITKDSDIQRSLFSHLHDCIETGATKDEIFCYVKGVELLSLQEKWLWTVSLFRSRINHLLKKCLQFEPPEDRQAEFNCLLFHVFQMLDSVIKLQFSCFHFFYLFFILLFLTSFFSSFLFSSFLFLFSFFIFFFYFLLFFFLLFFFFLFFFSSFFSSFLFSFLFSSFLFYFLLLFFVLIFFFSYFRLFFVLIFFFLFFFLFYFSYFLFFSFSYFLVLISFFSFFFFIFFLVFLIFFFFSVSFLLFS
ncbi:unnamed protein product [Acanthosepion pharaonis]|uniref:Uncharacterized protein n=1 Tax=Acanthosepion pharaonis TaxID=158019 RepID=A0A812CHN5_ACAPH|nr:unnamed protein product [Sepia pharaonis]